MRSIWFNDEGVSEMVGELMLLSITVTLFAILSTTVYSLMTGAPSAPILNVAASLPNNGMLVIQHTGGDSVSFGDLSYIVNNVEYNATSPQVSRADVNNNGLWDVGDTINISLPPSTSSVKVDIYYSRTNSILDEFSTGGS